MRRSQIAVALQVACEKLRWRCDVQSLEFETTEDVPPLQGVVGQDQALESLRFGLEVFAPGQNIFVRGLTGTGRLTLISNLLKEIQPACPLASDYCYVTCFEAPNEPRLLTLPRARGWAFREAIDRFVEFMRKDLPQALDSDALRERRELLDQGFEQEARKIADPFEAELKENGLTMVTATVGSTVRPMLLPLFDGEPAPPERVQQLKQNGLLKDEDIEAIEQKVQAFAKKLEGIAREMQKIQVRRTEEVRKLYREETRSLLGAEASRIREEFPFESVLGFLDEMIEDVLRHGIEELQSEENARRRYRVNVILGHHDDEPCPVIIENTPTLANLLGSIDRRVIADGVVVSDHLMISGGSLLHADGGFLVLEARDVLSEPGAWKVLVRTLRTGKLEIVPSEMGGPWGIRTLKPEPIPVNVKVILIGDPGLFYLLDSHDPDFPNLFKVLADFETSIERNAEGIMAYAGVLSRIARDERLAHFDRSAVAALAEHGARIAGRSDRLTARFGRLSDIAREAAYLTGKKADRFVSGDAVREAIWRTRRRADLPARKFRERVADGTIRLQLQGEETGQVNGLAVIQAGQLTYGFPSRITATIGAGAAGVINIERESQLSGAIHTKGFYILGGLLRHLLQTPHPLAFSASIAFEQSYGGIDGDSASGAEMCCLLSALTEVPLRQELAMTGAIDQHGHILPVGAVTEKIEGFHDVCAEVGLTGGQGVIIPRTNVFDLMLREDVARDCAEGRFHVYAVGTIQEALEILTGFACGERDTDGEYPEGTLLRAAVDQAYEYWSLAASTPLTATEAEAAAGAGGADEEGSEGRAADLS